MFACLNWRKYNIEQVKLLCWICWRSSGFNIISFRFGGYTAYLNVTLKDSSHLTGPLTLKQTNVIYYLRIIAIFLSDGFSTSTHFFSTTPEKYWIAFEFNKKFVLWDIFNILKHIPPYFEIGSEKVFFAVVSSQQQQHKSLSEELPLSWPSGKYKALMICCFCWPFFPDLFRADWVAIILYIILNYHKFYAKSKNCNNYKRIKVCIQGFRGK